MSWPASGEGSRRHRVSTVVDETWMQLEKEPRKVGNTRAERKKVIRRAAFYSELVIISPQFGITLEKKDNTRILRRG
jgi:hypothetical protein